MTLQKVLSSLLPFQNSMYSNTNRPHEHLHDITKKLDTIQFCFVLKSKETQVVGVRIRMFRDLANFVD